MKQYQELDSGVANLTSRTVLDAGGSTVDRVFADAIFASMPTLVVEQKGIMRGYEVEGQADIISVPIFTNFDLTFTDLSGTGSDTGSIAAVSQASAISYKDVRPVLRTGGIFVTETAGLLVNKASFEEHTMRAAIAAQRYKDRKIINDTVLNESAVTNIYAAGGFTSAGSVTTGSTLGPFDLSDAKALLSSGSDVYVPDVVVMHPTQYNQLLQSSDFRNDTYRVSDKATFVGGELVRYDGMDVVVTELVNGVTGSATTKYAVNGHPVAVFNKSKSAAYAQKSVANRVRTWNDIRRHGTYLYIDLMFESTVLIPASVVLLRAADA